MRESLRGFAARSGEFGHAILSGLTELLVASCLSPRLARLRLAGVFGLYIAGLAVWIYFLNFGSIDLRLHDWAEVSAPRYAFLKNAVSSGRLPLHMPGMWALRNVTDRFISVADTNLSPQVLLLKYLEVGDFILANTLLLFTLGFVGLVLLGRKLRLSFSVFALLYALLFFNGSIGAHLAVGHANWAAYFLIPFLLILVFELLDHPHRWRWATLYSLFMLFIFLQGAFHLFVASLLLVILVSLFLASERVTILLGAVFSILLSAVRVLPAALVASRFDTDFLSGFVSVDQLVAALVELKPLLPSEIFSNTSLSPLGWWEIDYYIGLVGLAFVLFFGYHCLRKKNESDGRLAALAIAVLIMTVLSIGRFYRVFHILEIPLFSSQRVATRLFALPLSLGIVLAMMGLQAWIDQNRSNHLSLLAAGAGVLVIGHDLWQHLKLWRVDQMSRLFEPKPLDLSLNTVANHSDPAYVAAIVAGIFLSIVSLGYLLLKVRSEG